MSRNTSKRDVSQPPGPEEETVDMAELMNGNVLEAGKTPTGNGKTGAAITSASKSSYAERMKTIRNPGAPGDHLGNMDRTQYDGLVARSAFERRMQAGKTGGLPPGSLSGIQPQSDSRPPSARKIERNQDWSSLPSSRESHRSAIGLPMTSSNTQKNHRTKHQALDQHQRQNNLSFIGLQRELSYGKKPISQQTDSGTTYLRKKLLEHETKVKSTAPKTVTHSSAITDEDMKMASQHLAYKTLTHVEKLKQDEWANKFFETNTPCPDRYSWEAAADGYQCKGGKHFITHLLVQELKHGLFIVPYGAPVLKPEGTLNEPNKDNSRGSIKTRWGPYYPHPDYVKIFMYSGPIHKPIPHGCPLTQGGDPSPEDVNEPNEEHRGQSPDKRLQLWLQFCADNRLEFSMELDNGAKGQPQIGPAKETVLKQIVKERAKSAAKAISKAVSKSITVAIASPTQAGRRAQSVSGKEAQSNRDNHPGSGSQNRGTYHSPKGDPTYHESRK